MKFRLTIFLLMANLAMFAAIWSLESAKVRQRTLPRDVASFTILEISGKNIDKPRVLKFENNQWRIVSPIDWKANLFAVNRIKTQLDFIDRQTSFSKTEAVKAGHSLDEYGLESPAYVLRYGDGEKMHTIKIGKNTSVGDRFYLLDDASDAIIVVDREFVEGLVQDMERLRDQSVFGMPRFEVSAFSVRLPIAKSAADAKGDFKRVGRDDLRSGLSHLFGEIFGIFRRSGDDRHRVYPLRVRDDDSALFEVGEPSRRLKQLEGHYYVGLAAADHRGRDLVAVLYVGDDRAAALTHSVDFGDLDVVALEEYGVSENAAGEQRTLSADADYHYIHCIFPFRKYVCGNYLPERRLFKKSSATKL